VKVAGAELVGGTEYSSDRDENTAGSQLYAIRPCENFAAMARWRLLRPA
jgi:hypothetical protein